MLPRRAEELLRVTVYFSLFLFYLLFFVFSIFFLFYLYFTLFIIVFVSLIFSFYLLICLFIFVLSICISVFSFLNLVYLLLNFILFIFCRNAADAGVNRRFWAEKRLPPPRPFVRPDNHGPGRGRSPPGLPQQGRVDPGSRRVTHQQPGRAQGELT